MRSVANFLHGESRFLHVLFVFVWAETCHHKVEAIQLLNKFTLRNNLCWQKSFPTVENNNIRYKSFFFWSVFMTISLKDILKNLVPELFSSLSPTLCSVFVTYVLKNNVFGLCTCLHLISYLPKMYFSNFNVHTNLKNICYCIINCGKYQ